MAAEIQRGVPLYSLICHMVIIAEACGIRRQPFTRERPLFTREWVSFTRELVSGRTQMHVQALRRMSSESAHPAGTTTERVPRHPWI